MDELSKRIGKRIREAREALGLTQEALARAVERVSGQPVSSVKVSYFETGARTPRVEDLSDFAVALGKPLEFFFAENETGQRTDDLVSTIMLRAVRPLNPSTAGRVQDIVDRILHAPVREEGVELRLVPRKTPSEILSILNITAPPVNLNRITFACGVEVQTWDVDDSISGLVVVIEGHTTIVVNKYQSATQKRFAIAHELGHLWLGHYPRLEIAVNFNGISKSAMDPAMEYQADQFARGLLMPEEWLRYHWHQNAGDLEGIAKLYDVGLQSLWVRLQELGIVKGTALQ